MVQWVLDSNKIFSSRAPRGQGKHLITLVYKNKLPFQKVPDNFAFMKKTLYLLTQLCLCASPQKSAVTFYSLDRSAQNFWGPLKSLQVIFGRVTQTLGPSGSGWDPKTRGYCQTYLLPGFWAGGSCHNFSESGQLGKPNVKSRNLIFCPPPEKMGPEGWAGLGAIYLLLRILSSRDWFNSYWQSCKICSSGAPRSQGKHRITQCQDGHARFEPGLSKLPS